MFKFRIWLADICLKISGLFLEIAGRLDSDGTDNRIWYMAVGVLSEAEMMVLTQHEYTDLIEAQDELDAIKLARRNRAAKSKAKTKSTTTKRTATKSAPKKVAPKKAAKGRGK